MRSQYHNLKEVSHFLASACPRVIFFAIDLLDISYAEACRIREQEPELSQCYYKCLEQVWQHHDEQKAKQLIFNACKENEIHLGYLRFLDHSLYLKQLIPSDTSYEESSSLAEHYQLNIHLLILAQTFWCQENLVLAFHNLLEGQACDIESYTNAIAIQSYLSKQLHGIRALFNILRTGINKLPFPTFWERLIQAFEISAPAFLFDFKKLAKKHEFLHYEL